MLLLSAGAAGWALLNTTLNSVQLFSISAHSYMLLVAALYPLYKEHRKSLVIYIMVIVSGIILTAYNIHSKSVPEISGTPSAQFTESVSQITSVNPDIRTGFLKNPASYSNGFHCYPHFSIPLPALASYTDKVVPISIGEYYCKDCNNTDACQKGIKLGLLHQWYIEHPGSSICDYIKSYNFGFLIVEKGAMLPECGHTKLLLTDNKTGMQLYSLEF